MELSGTQTLPVGQAEAWQALNDTDLLQRAIAGCESLVPNGEHQYDVLLAAAIGPVSARFKGRLRLSELDPPQGYTLHFDGQAGAAGHGKGTAQVRLEAVDAASTRLHYRVQASVGGRLAQVGSRVVDLAAQKMAASFFERFQAALQARQAAVPTAPMPAGPWARLAAWLRRLWQRLRRD